MQKILVTLMIALMALVPLASAAEQKVQTPQSKKPQVELSTEEMAVINEAVSQSTLLLQLKQKLAQAQYRHFVLQNNIETAKEGMIELIETVKAVREEITTLADQIVDTNKKIKSVRTQIERKKMEVADIEEEVQILELQFEDQKEVVGDLMTLLYVKREIFYDDDGVNALMVLASKDSVSQTFQKLTYLDIIEAENQVQIEKLSEIDSVLKTTWDKLRKKRGELDKLDAALQDELSVLIAQKKSKVELLSETENEMAIYEAMLISAGDKEEDILRDIEIYEKNVKVMEAKLTSTRTFLSDDQRSIIDQIELEAASEFGVNEAADFLDLDWPVSPKRGLTSYFIDEGYKALFGVQHYALDIRANHGSPIFAPADGVVYNVVYNDESTRYAYVMIAHRKGVMTLFGHVSDVDVKPGEYVSRGQIIGLTGATPGTVGAGVRTTGPHLHIEVWQDGIRVDPLKYLPLEEVPADSLPEEYLEQMRAELEAQILEIQSALST